MREKTEGSEAIVEGDHGDAMPGQMRPIKSVFRTSTAEVSPAMNPDHDGVLGLAVKRGGPDIEKEAILALYLYAQIETGTAFLETGRGQNG